MTCCCSLAGTAACNACVNRSMVFMPSYPSMPFPKLKTGRVIEKFDEKGNLIERITEEL